jgi:hypothetical protein
LVVLKTDGTQETLLEIENAPGAISPPRLERDGLSRIVYGINRSEWLIDVKSKTATPHLWRNLGQKFESAVEPDRQGFHAILHDGAPIGRWMCNPRQSAVTKDRIAVIIWPKKLSPATGVAIWDRGVGEWRVVEVQPDGLIGWGK